MLHYYLFIYYYHYYYYSEQISLHVPDQMNLLYIFRYRTRCLFRY